MVAENLTRGERTRAEIFQAAHLLFLENGYHGTSMRQIAQRAGIALGGIYNHFDSKENLFLAVILEHHPVYDVLPALQAAQGETVEEFIRDAARRMVGRVEDRLEFLNLMFIEFVEFNGQHLPTLYHTVFPQVMEFTERFVRARSEIRPIPPFILVSSFIGLFFSYLLTEMFLGKQFPQEMQQDAIDHFVDIYLHGVLKRESPASQLHSSQGIS